VARFDQISPSCRCRLPRVKPPINRDVDEAAKNIVIMDLAILQAEAAAGMYKKPIEELAKQVDYEPLPDEVRITAIEAWKRGGLVPRAIVETMVPALPGPEASPSRAET
jgi:hypothetical protein